MNKLWKPIVPLIIGVFLIGSVFLTLTSIGRQTAPAVQALSPERVAHYESLMEKSIRTEAYLIAPAIDVVYEQVLPELSPDATDAEIQAAIEAYYQEFHLENNKVSRPNPLAQIGRAKALEIAELRGLESTTALTGTPEILTIMMNFDGEDTYTTSDPAALFGTCLTDTAVYPPTYTFTVDGPAFNEVEQPTDNWTPWLDPNTSYTGGFTKEYFDLLMFSTTGYTEPMRTELPNPWTGGNGFDFSDVSFKNWHLENSRGVYDPQGLVEDITIPVAVSYFGAARCNGAVQDDGYWGRPRYTVAISAAQQINTEFPGASNGTNAEFSWTEWDQEDVIDYDNDGDFFEPDGYVDHFFLIEAGEAQGGKYGEFLIWPHSSDVMPATPEGPPVNQLGGYQVSTDGPLGGVWVLNYTVSDEVGGLGVLVHEYGHDIGLPDNYAIAGALPNNTGFWDQMSSGTFGGGLSGMHPTHHTIWDKAEPYLGWNSPVEIDITTTPAMGEENAITYAIGQQSKPPAGTIDGLRINLPDNEITSFVDPYDNLMFYSDQGDDRSESIAQVFTPTVGEDITVTAQLAYDIEVDWDYLYWEVSGTGTSGFEALPVFSGTVELTTDTDPNNNNPNGNGITDHTSGWVTATAVISAPLHGGNEMTFRFRYFTDAAVQNEGVYLDNISIDSPSGNILTDDMESGDNWMHMSEGINTNNPWYIFEGLILVEQYYLVEWRNSGEGTGTNGVPTEDAFETAGFDIGLNRMYWINGFDEQGAIAQVDRFHNHTPGMLVWYADGAYNDNSIDNYWFDIDPAYGPKGRVLLVDANPDAYLVDAVDSTGASAPRQVNGRRSSFDAAFTLGDRPAFTLGNTTDVSGTDVISMTEIPGGMAQPNFRDRIGSFQGTDSFFTGIGEDTGVVLPTVDNVQYHSSWIMPYTSAPRTGNPGVNAFGVNLEVVSQAEDGTYAMVKFWMDDDSVFVDKTANSEAVHVGDVVTYTVSLKDASGTRYDDRFNFTYTATMTDALPMGVTLITDSVTLSGGGDILTTTDDFGQITVLSDQILWEGKLGANRINEPDAFIEYAVMIDEAGCYTNETTLSVTQQMITDTHRNGGAPFMWPKSDEYGDEVEVCASNYILSLPIIMREPN